MCAKLIVAVETAGTGPIVASAIVLPAEFSEPSFVYRDGRNARRQGLLLSKHTRIAASLLKPIVQFVKRSALSFATVQSDRDTRVEVAGRAVVRALERLMLCNPTLLDNVERPEIRVYTSFKQRIPADFMSSLGFVRGIRDWRLGAAALIARAAYEQSMLLNQTLR